MAGKKDEAEGFPQEKAEFNELRKQYKKLLDRDDRASHARAWHNSRKSSAGESKPAAGH